MIPLFAIMVLSYSLSRYNQLYFIFRNTITFVFFGLLVTRIILRVYRSTTKDKEELLESKKGNYIRISVVVTTVVALLVVAGVQRTIVASNAPVIGQCFYYDSYGNYIHNSRLPQYCVDPVVEDIGTNTKVYKFEYLYDGMGANSYEEVINDITHLYEYTRIEEGALYEEVTIEYTEDNLIKSFNTKIVFNYIENSYSRWEFDENDYEYTFIDSVKKSNYIEFDLENDFSEEFVTQSRYTYDKTGVVADFDDITYYTFYEFSGLEDIYTAYYLEFHINRIDDADTDNSHYSEFDVYYDNLEKPEDEIKLWYSGYYHQIYQGSVLTVNSAGSMYSNDEESSRLPLSEITVEYSSYKDEMLYTQRSWYSKYAYNYVKENDVYFFNKYTPLSGYTGGEDFASVNDYNNYTHINYRNGDSLLYQTNYGMKLEMYTQASSYPYTNQMYNDTQIHSLLHLSPYSGNGVSMDNYLNNNRYTTSFHKLDSVFEYIIKITNDSY